MDKTFILDSSAIFTFLEQEEGADLVENILSQAKRHECTVWISFITVAEFLYITWQEKGESAARELIALIKTLPLSIMESNEKITLTAGKLKAQYRLSLGDAFIAAAAVLAPGILVHKDPEFRALNDMLQTKELPMKRK